MSVGGGPRERRGVVGIGADKTEGEGRRGERERRDMICTHIFEPIPNAVSRSLFRLRHFNSLLHPEGREKRVVN